MSVELKVLEKAIAAKDFNLLAKRLVQKARELGWTDDDIIRLGEKLLQQCQR